MIMYKSVQIGQKVYSNILKAPAGFFSVCNNLPSRLSNSLTLGKLNVGRSSRRSFISKACLSSLSRPVYNKSNLWSFSFNLRIHQFHTTQSRHIHPLVLLVLRPLSKAGAILVGRGVRKWWQSLPPSKKKYIWDRIVENRIKLYVTTGIITFGTVIFYQTHLEEAPLSKRKRFILFDADKFNTITNEVFKMTIDTYKGDIIPVSHPVYKLVANVTDRLLLGNKDIEQVHNKKWSITIVDDPACNAFVLPNGQIFVFTGMLKFCENEDQLGCILGHEMAHALLGHSAESLSYTHLIDMAMMVVIALIWALLPSDLMSIIVQSISTKITNILIELPYNRMLESEADVIGLQLATKACFDIREIVVFWKKLNAASQIETDQPVEWLSTHPVHDARANTLDDLVPECLEKRKHHQCPPLPKGDPRDLIKSYEQWYKNLNEQEFPVAVYLKPPPR